VLFAILTLFPEALEAYADVGVLRMARDKGLAEVLLVDFRDFTRDRHRTVDDRPFGGGPGMLLKPEPIAECIEWLERRHGPFRKLALCPSGRLFRQETAAELATEERVLLLCGRYEGFDQRLIEHFGIEELSIGDFVLAGGELAALAVVEASLRLVPGVLGDERSAQEDSFGAAGGLDHPHYTRPREFRGLEAPPVLLSGDHARIARWRAEQASTRTRSRRPDLLPNDDVRAHERTSSHPTGHPGVPPPSARAAGTQHPPTPRTVRNEPGQTAAELPLEDRP
jgi:tRNA (guanine37-N1)-methyltransferase